MKTKPRRTDDKGVPRRYLEAKKNPMFPDWMTACLRFVHYKESVPCALCKRLSKYHWTCLVRFKAADFKASRFVLKLSRNWFPRGTPVCQSHPMHMDKSQVDRLIRDSIKAQKKKV